MELDCGYTRAGLVKLLETYPSCAHAPSYSTRLAKRINFHQNRKVQCLESMFGVVKVNAA